MHRREDVFKLENGLEWTRNWDRSDASDKTIGRLVAFVSARSGVQRTEVDLLTNGEL